MVIWWLFTITYKAGTGTGSHNIVVNIEFSSVARISTKLGHIVLQKTTTLGATFKTDLTRKDMKWSQEPLLFFSGYLAGSGLNSKLALGAC